MSRFFRWMLVLAAFMGVGCFHAASVEAGEASVKLKPYSVTLSVSNIEKMASWYGDILGFRRVSAKSYPEFKTSLVFLENDGFRVELIADGNARAGIRRADPPAHTSVTGVSQFAFEVSNIDEAHAALAAKKVDFAWTLQRYPDLGVAFFFVRDPEGNLVQFIQRLP